MADTYYTNVSLLLHGDGTNGSTTFTDSGPAARTVTPTGGAQISTGQVKFGSAAMNFPGGSDYLSTAANSAFDFGSGDFTIESWIWLDSSLATGQTLFSQRTSSTPSGVYAGIVPGSPSVLSVYLGDGSSWFGIATPINLTGATNSWHHYAITRNGSSVYIFFDGALVYTITGVGGTLSSGNGFVLGYDLGNFSPFKGYMDDFRITKGVARYTSTFTPPTAALDDTLATDHTVAALSAQPGALFSYFGLKSFPSAPSGTMSSNFGGYAQMSSQVPTVSCAFGSKVAMSASPGILTAVVRDTSGENAAFLSAPSPSLTGTFGFTLGLSAPQPIMVAGLTVSGMVKAFISAPPAQVSANGTGTPWSLTAAVSAPTPSMVGYGGAVWSVTIPAGSAAAYGTAGGIIRGSFVAPLFDLTSSVSLGGMVEADLIAPMAKPAGSLLSYQIAPAGVLTAIGSAVVTATYEAYAINLNHTPRPGVDPVDETTRYTNYPFDRIVRYKNSYFGMNSTGLYLLEGTTDAGTDTAWAFQTAETDFKSPQKKTVEMIYFGGRLPPAVTISLIAREDTANTYAYTTPRGPHAQNYRQPFGRGVKARYFSFGVAGTGTLEIDSVTLNVTTLARKV